MDYSKFVRKDMPLAVPHQKPPRKYASHPYPVLVDEGRYLYIAEPLNCSLVEILKKSNPEEFYFLSAIPIDSILKSILISRDIDNKEGYLLTAKPLDSVTIPVITNKEINSYESYLLTAKPLDGVIREVLITYSNEKNDGYAFLAKPLQSTKI